MAITFLWLKRKSIYFVAHRHGDVGASCLQKFYSSGTFNVTVDLIAVRTSFLEAYFSQKQFFDEFQIDFYLSIFLLSLEVIDQTLEHLVSVDGAEF